MSHDSSGNIHLSCFSLELTQTCMFVPYCDWGYLVDISNACSSYYIITQIYIFPSITWRTGAAKMHNNNRLYPHYFSYKEIRTELSYTNCNLKK